MKNKTPRHDWDKEDGWYCGFLDAIDHFNDWSPTGHTATEDNLGSRLIPISALDFRSCADIEALNPEWKTAFKKRSVYPPILVEAKSNGTFQIIDGHHRVIMWREFGFTRVPAWVVTPDEDAPPSPEPQPTGSTTARSEK